MQPSNEETIQWVGDRNKSSVEFSSGNILLVEKLSDYTYQLNFEGETVVFKMSPARDRLSLIRDTALDIAIGIIQKKIIDIGLSQSKIEVAVREDMRLAGLNENEIEEMLRDENANVQW